MRRAHAFATVLAAGLLAAGCGGDDEDTNGTTNGGADGGAVAPETEPRTQKNDRAEAIQLCLEQARRIPDPPTRRTVEQTCRAGQTGDPSAALESARQQCLDNAGELPAGDVRDRVREACERIAR